MVERICENQLKDMCRVVVKRYNPSLVRLKVDKTEKPENPFKDFVSNRFGWFDTYLVGMSKPRAMCHDKCVKYFYKNAEKLCFKFIEEKYHSDVEYAMFRKQNFEALFQDFLNWFDNKRRKIQMEFNVVEAKKAMLEKGKRPNSHGGVANLLKTLTKTMEKQGASIQTIAKVQYTICMQAGIYIPDEFIEDVAVALNIIGEEK
jgi:hypothetical protein